MAVGHDDRGAEGAIIETPKAPSGVGYGEVCPLPSRLGVWESVVSSPSGVRAEPRPLSHFLHILGHWTLLVARKIRFSCPKYKEKLVFGINSTLKKWWWQVTIVTYKVAPMGSSPFIPHRPSASTPLVPPVLSAPRFRVSALVTGRVQLVTSSGPWHLCIVVFFVRSHQTDKNCSLWRHVACCVLHIREACERRPSWIRPIVTQCRP